MNHNLIIYGAGQNGRAVIDILRYQNTYKIAGLIDDNQNLLNKKVVNIPIIGSKDIVSKISQNGEIVYGFVSIGDNRIRSEKTQLLKNNNFKLVNTVHPSAIISHDVTIGENVQISPGVIINNNCRIGNNVIINTGSTIDHDNTIENNVHIGPGVHLAGVVTIKEFTFIGIGSTVINNIKIGRSVIIGAGSVITQDVPDNVVVVGVPGKIIKHKEISQ